MPTESTRDASGQHRDDTKGKSLFLFFGFVCVCCEALSGKVGIVQAVRVSRSRIGLFAFIVVNKYLHCFFFFISLVH